VIVSIRDRPRPIEEQVGRDTPEASAFAEAVRPHLLTLVRLAARLAPRVSPDDVVQDALIRAWRHRRRYDPKKGAMRSWLMAIVANEARRAATRRILPIPTGPPIGGVSAEEHVAVKEALRRLPARQKLAVDCYYFAGLSTAETAAVMGCAEGTVKSTLADARARLRRELEG
jgi:RNA polymerase sigma factor (sigma-70 family)